MKSGVSTSGFTIAETLIFLAVSSLLLVSALTLVNGSKNKNEFVQAINDVQQQINSVATNVATGYYSGPDSIACQNVSGTPVLNLTGAAQPRGSNSDCVYIGGVLKFSTGEDYILYSVAGARKTDTAIKRDVTDMADAKPTVVGTPRTLQLKNGLRVGWIKVGASTIDSIGFFSTFGQQNAAAPDQLTSAPQHFDFVGIDSGGLSLTPPTAYIQGNTASSFKNTYDSKVNPSSGIKICFNSGSTDQNGVITIGGDNRTSTTSLEIFNGACS